MPVETFARTLPHGITLSCRAAGAVGRPVLMFLHGFPEGAFIWDALLLHFAKPQHGGYRCVAPNLRGFEASSAPPDISHYRPKHLVQDIAALIAIETQATTLVAQPADAAAVSLAALIAHDWGGAIAWNLINQQPALAERLVIVNSPHPGAYVHELTHSAEQQAASAYMTDLIAPGAEACLVAHDFEKLWLFLTDGQPNGPSSHWLTEPVKNQYRQLWSHGLRGGCNLYRASPLRPPTASDRGAADLQLPASMLTITVPTMVIWGMNDTALRPALMRGLDAWVPRLTCVPVPQGSHWVIHQQPKHVAQLIENYLLLNL